MLVMLSAATVGFITNVVVVLLWVPGLPLFVDVVPIPLTVTVGAIMARLVAPEEPSMFF
jgi:hypothetical protein